MADKKTKTEEKIIPKEELKKYREWYKPSNSEKILLSRILYEIKNILDYKRINGNVRWSNEKKAYISIPYGEKAKIEVICDETFSIEVYCLIDNESKKVKVMFKLFRENNSFTIDDMSVKHGYIDHESRTYNYEYEKFSCNCNGIKFDYTDKEPNSKQHYNNNFCIL